MHKQDGGMGIPVIIAALIAGGDTQIGLAMTVAQIDINIGGTFGGTTLTVFVILAITMMAIATLANSVVISVIAVIQMQTTVNLVVGVIEILPPLAAALLTTMIMDLPTVNLVTIHAILALPQVAAIHAILVIIEIMFRDLIALVQQDIMIQDLLDV